MKLIRAALAAVCMLSATAVWADQSTTTSVEIVTRDAVSQPDNEHTIVPFLFMVFMALTSN